MKGRVKFLQDKYPARLNSFVRKNKQLKIQEIKK